MHKVAALMPQWLDDLESPADSLPEISTIMEDAGTGGGLFRAMWPEPSPRDVGGAESSREALHSASKPVHEAAEEEQHLMGRLLQLSS